MIYLLKSIIDRIGSRLFLDVNDPELAEIAAMHLAFEKRLSSTALEVQREFAFRCLQDDQVFETHLGTLSALTTPEVEPSCHELFAAFDRILVIETGVELGCKLVRPLRNERKFDPTVAMINEDEYTIIGGTSDPKDSMLIQRDSSVEVLELSECEHLEDVVANPQHRARFKNIFVWIGSTWYVNQDNPNLDPMSISL